MKLNRVLSVLAGLVAGLSLSVPAGAAGTVTGGSFNATIAITAACSMGAGTNAALDFGSVASTDTTAVNETNQAGFSVVCTNLLPFNIGLQPANGDLTGAGVMKGAANTATTIAYQLYSDSGRTAKWGNTTGVSGNTLSATGAGATAVPFKVYGKLTGGTLASQNLPVDSYSDTVAISVYY